MVTPGEREFAGNAADRRADFGSTELSALTVALGRLVAASDGVADAVTHHDRIGLIKCNEQAESLVDEVNAGSAHVFAKDTGTHLEGDRTSPFFGVGDDVDVVGPSIQGHMLDDLY